MIRWKALVPTLVIIGLVVAFCIFFLDPLVECGIERAGTAVNGAKVELDKVDISLRNLSAKLHRLQITDKEDPMTNALEIESLKFDLAGKPLTWKKIIIEKGEITGIRAGTPRKSSGAISKRAQKGVGEPAEDEESAGEKAKEKVSFAMTNLKEQYDPKKLIVLENLASYKKIQEEQGRIGAMAENWEKRVDSIQVEDKTASAKALAERARSENFSGAEGLKKAKDLLKEADKVRDDLKQARSDFNSVAQGVKSEIAQARDSIRQIDALKKQDLENSMAQLKAGAFSAEGITRGLIGPKWFAKLQSWLGWFHKARKLMPAKKEGEKPEPPAPRVGKEIPFPFKYNWPALHLKLARVTGTAGAQKPISYEGSLMDVTSDPKIVGKPMVLDVSNEKQGSDIAFAFRAELDYTKDVPREAAKVKYAGVPLSGIALGELEAPVSIKDGRGVASADLQTTGDQLSGSIRFNAQPIALNYQLPPEKAGNKLLSTLQNVLTGLTELNVEVGVSNTVSQPRFDPKTNLDNAFNDAVKQVLQKELDELKAQFRARVDELVDGERQKFASLVESKTGVAAGKLNSKEGVLRSAEEQMDKVKDDLRKKAEQSIPVPIPGSGGEKPATEDIKKDIKGIFKKK